jgi:putative membrane protein insertion efficiency factor
MVCLLSGGLAIFSKASCASLIFIVRFYQVIMSPFLAGRCRFYPSCSNYAIEAIKTRGCIKGMWLTIKRLARCHPGHPGGIDEVLS